MKPISTPFTNSVFKLPGGTDENDLPVERTTDYQGVPCMVSMWELTEEECKQISQGTAVRLVVWGTVHPPVSLAVGRDHYVEVKNDET